MAPSPSDRSMPMSVPGLPIDGIEIDLTDIDDMEDIEDVLATINASEVPPVEPETVEDVDAFASLDLDGIDDAFDPVEDQDTTAKPLKPEPEHSSPSLLSTVRRAWRRGWDWMNGGPSEPQHAGARAQPRRLSS